MRKWIGAICVALGAACLLSAVGFVLYNRWEATAAAESAQSLLNGVNSLMEGQGLGQPDADGAVAIPGEMATVTVDGHRCIGVLSVPVLELELPVLTDWSYAKLKTAPCHYYGTYYQKDFVIAAHNYPAHFGRLSELQPGDLVLFTAVDGTVYSYEVVLLETLQEEAMKEMITSGFDLTLYTCTAGGGNRVTVRCKAVTGISG